MVYKLVKGYTGEGVEFLVDKKIGRPCIAPCGAFSEKIIALRKETDYGSEKLHIVLKKEGFAVSQRQIQKILDLNKLTEPCEKRRGQRKYVRYQWPISNYMWHCDWTEHKGKWYLAFIDDRSRKIMAAGCFTHATEDNVIFLLYQAMLWHGVCPVIVLSDKGTQFYNSTPNRKGELTPSRFEQELSMLGIEFWTSRRNHPQTNGKMEKWFDTLKKRFKRHPETDLQKFVIWYNEKRIHHALAYDTPERIYQENL
jgi:putative transposase